MNLPFPPASRSTCFLQEKSGSPLVYKKQLTTLLPQQLLNIRCHPPESLQLFIFLQEMRIARFGSFYSSNHQVTLLDELPIGIDSHHSSGYRSYIVQIVIHCETEVS